jgi:hypothetical protein
MGGGFLFCAKMSGASIDSIPRFMLLLGMVLWLE